MKIFYYIFFIVFIFFSSTLFNTQIKVNPCHLQVLLHVLFEHAAGYALFAVREVEEIGMLLPQVSVSGFDPSAVVSPETGESFTVPVVFHRWRRAWRALPSLTAWWAWQPSSPSSRLRLPWRIWTQFLKAGVFSSSQVLLIKLSIHWVTVMTN